MEGKVLITLGPRATMNRVEIDGADVTNYCSNLSVEAIPGETPRINLTLMPWVTQIKGSAEVIAKFLEKPAEVE